MMRTTALIITAFAALAVAALTSCGPLADCADRTAISSTAAACS